MYMGKFLILVSVVAAVLFLGWIVFNIFMFMLPFLVVAVVMVAAYYIYKSRRNKRF